MPPKLNVKQKSLGGSAPNTPTDSSAPDMKLGGKMATEDCASADAETSAVQGVITRKQRGKGKKTVSGKAKCMGNDDNPCGKDVKDGDMGGIECEICWVVSSCLPRDENEAYDAVRKNGLFWICMQCKKLLPEFKILCITRQVPQPR